MNLLPLPAFSDNYIWMMHDGKKAIVVDPGDADAVFDVLRGSGLSLEAILVTHHHGDHVGGVEDLHAGTGARVYGPANEIMPEPITRLAQGDVVEEMGLKFQVIDVPGHTSGHIAFYCPDMDGTPILFCGDTLFSGGCGRLFEGTPAQMHASLQRLAALPGETLICCGHEYTLANAAFATTVDPGNAALRERAAEVRRLRATDQPSLPSTLHDERACNPFLRCEDPAVRASVAAHAGHPLASPVDVFAHLRNWKDGFRG